MTHVKLQRGDGAVICQTSDTLHPADIERKRAMFGISPTLASFDERHGDGSACDFIGTLMDFGPHLAEERDAMVRALEG